MSDGKGIRTGDRNSNLSQLTVRDAEAFRALIVQEKGRADRSGEGFALLVVDVGSDDHSASRIVPVLAENLRQIDMIGRLDSLRMGAMLPSTTTEGATKLAERVFGDERLKGRRIAYRVYVYPWNSLPLGAGESAEVDDATADHADSPSLPPFFCRPMPLWKRAFDLVCSSLLVLVLWPLLLAVAAYIKLVSPGPVFYKQRRVGYGGKLFTFMKFRTMKTGGNELLHKQHIVERLRGNQPLAKLDDAGDPRIIRGGRIIRRACIDELPQLINVIRGEMSLVGPRPCLPYEAAELLRWHGQRFDVVPGITGLWQVSGKNKLSLAEMIRLDISYAHKMSLWFDFWILLRTPPAILAMIGESVLKRLRKARLRAE